VRLWLIDQQDTSSRRVETWSGANGEFVFDAAPSGERIELHAWKEGHALHHPGSLGGEYGRFEPLLVSIDAGSARELKVTMLAGSRIGGSVLDARTGAPLAAADVRTRPHHLLPVELDFPRTRTGPDGRFAFEVLAPTSWRLVAGAPGYVPRATTVRAAWKFEPAGSPPEVEIRLDPGVSVRGSVTNAAGAPVAGAAITWTSAGGNGGMPGEDAPRSRLDGSFDILVPAAGPFTLAAQHDDFVQCAELAVEQADPARPLALRFR
jgi:hypothetical protein